MRSTVGQLGAGRSSALGQVTADQDGVTRPLMLMSFRRFGDNGAHHQRQAPALGSPPSLAAGPEIRPATGSTCRCDFGDLTCGVACRPPRRQRTRGCVRDYPAAGIRLAAAVQAAR